jgi:hypothetical protein
MLWIGLQLAMVGAEEEPMQTHEQYQCCFCGLSIKEAGPDPCSLSLTAKYLASPEAQVTQGLFCHLKCLAKHLHPSVKLYVKDLLGEG